jgi:hypothetical protein
MPFSEAQVRQIRAKKNQVTIFVIGDVVANVALALSFRNVDNFVLGVKMPKGLIDRIQVCKFPDCKGTAEYWINFF